MAFILYKITIGHAIESFSTKVKSLTNQHSRIELKQKILSEIKKDQKRRIFSLMRKELLYQVF